MNDGDLNLILVMEYIQELIEEVIPMVITIDLPVIRLKMEVI
jgi:hypothetical protein